MDWKIRPWLRRLITRLAAIVPAIFLIGVRADGDVNDLLNLSQVVLAIQLPLAMFPLLWFTGSRKLMGAHRDCRLDLLPAYHRTRDLWFAGGNP